MMTPLRAMTPEDLTRIRTASDPQVAPDGQRVVFVVTILSEKRDEYLSNIWLTQISGRTLRRYTAGPGRDTMPRWSPDGQQLAFLSSRHPEQTPQLYVMPADGGEARCLTEMANGIDNLAWSPDSTQLVFSTRVGGWQEPTDETGRRQSKPARVITTMQYKANGEGFIYDRRRHLFVVTVNNSEIRQLTDGDWNDNDPVWSPDGQHIAFTSARHADWDYDNAVDIWLISALGGDPIQLTDTAGPLSTPEFSPDGTQLAYLGNRFVNQSGHNTQVFTISLPRGEPTCLTTNLDRTCTAFYGPIRPLWSPDGSALFVVAEDRGCIHVYLLDTSGDSAPIRIIDGDRHVTGLSMSPDGTNLVFTATDPVSPSEVFVCHADESSERPLTELNLEWQQEVALSAPLRITYTRDGFELDCWMMKPYGYTPGECYPALLNIHGGPHMSYGNAFFDEFQVYTGAGYAVIYTNPRGSQGYGEAFTQAVLGDWGGEDYLDVMAGLDAAIAEYDFIDPKRLGIMGGSYGGFMTSWVLSHTNRFKAACSERAVNNIATLFGTSDIGYNFMEMESGYLPWDNMQWYIEHSPLTYAKDIDTPLLIIHSENDLRCSIQQAEELFISLKKLRKEVLFIRFPDENHDLSRSGQPRHRLERFRLILHWFAQYLA